MPDRHNRQTNIGQTDKPFVRLLEFDTNSH